MDNKLSELSKPLYLRCVDRGTGETLYTPCGKDYPRGKVYYSQEYVSALLEKLKVTESDRDKNGWYVHECARLQKLLERHGVKYE